MCIRDRLYAVGRNIAIDYIRKNAKEKTVSLDDCAERADEELLENRCIKEEQKIVLYRAMNKLKPEMCIRDRFDNILIVLIVAVGHFYFWTHFVKPPVLYLSLIHI